MKIKLKRLIFIVLILLFQNVNLIAQEDPRYGAIKLNDSTYLDQTEIYLFEWLAYYSWVLKNEGYVAAKKVLPDSCAIDPDIWNCISKRSKKFNENSSVLTGAPLGYFNHDCKCLDGKEHSIFELPVTGVSYEQVVDYCKFRTKQNRNNSATYRLPSPDEWREFAIRGLINKEKLNYLPDSLDKKKCLNFNYKSSFQCNRHIFLNKLNIVGSFDPDKNGLYDFFGNLSEMTSIKGVSKGGNYNLYAKQCHVDSTQYYTKPEKWLGFRCLIIIRQGKMTK